MAERMIYKEVIWTFAEEMSLAMVRVVSSFQEPSFSSLGNALSNSVYDAGGPQIKALLHVVYLLIVKREFRHVNLVSFGEGYGRTLSLLILMRERLAYLPMSFR